MCANFVRDFENTTTELEDQLSCLNLGNGLSKEELVSRNSTFNTMVKLLLTKMTPLQKETSPFSDIIGLTTPITHSLIIVCIILFLL